MTVLPDDDDFGHVELGLPDGPLDGEEEGDPFVSKIGGKPTLLFPSAVLAEGLRCGFDRVAYVFACNSRECTESGLPGVAVALFQCQRQNQSQSQAKAKASPSPRPAGLWDSMLLAPSGTEEDSLRTEEASLRMKMHSLSVAQGEEEGVRYMRDYEASFPATGMHIVDELISLGSASKRSVPSPSAAEMGEGEAWSGETYEKMQIIGYDKVFKNFHTRVSHYPRQLVRFSPEGKPLLFNADPIPNIEVCRLCDRPRHFELQLMPAILCKLAVNSPKFLQHIPKDGRNKHPLFEDGMEWGTILVYTCGTCRLAQQQALGSCETLAQVVIQIEKDTN